MNSWFEDKDKPLLELSFECDLSVVIFAVKLELVLLKTTLSENERAIVIGLKGDADFRKFLLSNGIMVGTIFQMSYSPHYLKLANLIVGNRFVSVRQSEFEKIDWLRI